MKTCSESHARVELDDDLVWSRVVVMPGCFHQRAASNSVDAVLRLPGVGPILLRTFGDAQIADRAEPAEMPERLPDGVDRPWSNVGRIEKGPNDDRLSRIDGEIVTIRVLGERLLDGDPLVEAV